tara:strand:- start:2497 stop:3351 length:855 start_codon:yes stop_codon:yes gene_type:complete
VTQVVFIADFFDDQVTGGAELHDEIVIQYFRKIDIFFEKKRCAEITKQYVIENIDKVWFIGNFTRLSKEVKQLLIDECKYILYEHDYKFLSNRNPISFPNFIAPKSYLCNLDFYESAHKVVCMTPFHKNICERNLQLDNLTNINCSMWSDKDLDFIKGLQNHKKKKGVFAVIESKNPIKKTAAAIRYCKTHNISYELISSNDYYEFLSALSNYEGLVFVTGHPESCGRVAVEAKMLNCEFVSQKRLVAAANEDYFRFSGTELIEKVRSLRNQDCEYLKEIVTSI